MLTLSVDMASHDAILNYYLLLQNTHSILSLNGFPSTSFDEESNFKNFCLDQSKCKC